METLAGRIAHHESASMSNKCLPRFIDCLHAFQQSYMVGYKCRQELPVLYEFVGEKSAGSPCT